MKSGLENLTVLLVEDNAFMIGLVDRVLRHLGFERIHRAHDGEEAIRFLREVKKRPERAGTSSEATKPGTPEDDNSVAIIKAHVDAMRVVVRDQIKGDGGDGGRALLESLHSAIQRHSLNRVKGRNLPLPRAR